jgi:hypothetical protein
MNEKEGKSRVVKLSNCMWCDFFEKKKCELQVETRIIKEEWLSIAATETHKTYGPVDKNLCKERRKEYNKTLR